MQRLNGIDVSYANGKVNWNAVKTADVDFAMVKASQGKLVANANSGAFTDPQFAANMKGAVAAGIPVGVYHYLCAGTLAEAKAEAKYFMSVIEPYRDKISLWAVCDAEEDKYLPQGKAALTEVIHAFLEAVQQGGFKPMLYSNPNYLVYKLGDVSRWDLWLAYWNTSEAQAKMYSPKIWQYGAGTYAGMKNVDMNYGYFANPEKVQKEAQETVRSFRAGDRVRVKQALIYGTDRKFKTYYDTYDVISVSGDRVVIGIGKAITAAVAAENLEMV